MICMLCGTKNRDGANRCKECGANLSPSSAGPIGRAPAPTVLESPGGASPGGGYPGPAGGAGGMGGAGGGRRTVIVTPDQMGHGGMGGRISGQGAPGRGRTVYVPPPDSSRTGASEGPGQARAPSLPPLAGFLVTFTWSTSGQAYPVREGKNTFGSKPEECDGCIPSDRAISGKHFAIMVRRGQFRVRDLDSTNATVVDGEEIWGDSLPAGHGSIIKAGDTEFQLVLIPDRPAPASAPAPPVYLHPGGAVEMDEDHRARGL